MNKHVLITGGSGLIGKALAKKLIERGYQVAILSRNPEKTTSIPAYAWDIENMTIDQNAIKQADYIIHLAGTNVGDKNWTSSVKKDIVTSRVQSSKLLYESLQKNNNLKAFISSSAVGFYGFDKSEHIFDETDKNGNDFLAKVCFEWEKAVEPIQKLGIRTVIVRTGVVLAKNGGALAEMVKPIKLGLGSALGSGKQYIPWIHIDDICAIYIQAIENEQMQGAYNAVSSEHINNQLFSKYIAQIIEKPFFLPNVPAFAIKFALGERAQIALEGNKVSNAKLLQTGFKFLYHSAREALEEILLKK